MLLLFFFFKGQTYQLFESPSHNTAAFKQSCPTQSLYLAKIVVIRALQQVHV